MIDHLLTQPAVITPRSSTTVDGYGDEVLTEGTPVETVGFWQQDGEGDARVDEDQATSDGWVFLPPGTTIDRNDSIAIAGVTVEVVGRPRTPTRPALGEHHVEARGRLVEG